MSKYNDFDRAKNVIDVPLIRYVKNQSFVDPSFLLNISVDAYNGMLYGNSINELVAEVEVNEDTVIDKDLLNIVKEMLDYGYNGKITKRNSNIHK